MRQRRQPEIIAGQVVGSTGAIASCSDPRVSVVRTAQGSYSVTLPSDFRPVGITVSSIGGSVTVANITNGITANVFQVSVFLTNTGGASDTSWSFVAVGVQQ